MKGTYGPEWLATTTGVALGLCIVADGDAPYYTPANGDVAHTNAYMKTGKVLITSLTANTPSGENATYTAEFQGVGALSKQDAKTQ